MYCNHCGQPNKDGALFCGKCGRKITVVAAPEPPAAEIPVTPAFAPENSLAGSGDFLAAIKKVACGPVFLIALIIFSAQTLYSVIHGFTGYGVPIYIFFFACLAGAERAVITLFEENRVLNLFNFLPNILAIAGLWMIFAAAMGKKVPLKTGGFTMVLVMTIFRMVESSFTLLWMLREIGNKIARIGSTYIIVYALMRVYDVVYYIPALLSLSKGKKSFHTGTGHYNASVLMAVLMFIGTGTRILGLLIPESLYHALFDSIGPVIDFLYVDATTHTVVIYLCSAAVSILFGITIFQFRKAMYPFRQKSAAYGSPYGTGASSNLYY